MLDETLRVLEFDKVLGFLAGATVTGPGRERALLQRPMDDLGQVRNALAEVEEAVALLESTGPVPVGGLHDLAPVLKQLGKPGSFVSPELLLQVRSSVEAAQACRRFFQSGPDDARLVTLSQSLEPLSELGGELASAIGERGDILDSASFELGDIRQGIRQSRSRIKQLLEGMLVDYNLETVFQDRIITQRNGRYVVPLKADYRGSIKGFVHDQSSSGQTLFIEPVKVLPLNNELRSLLADEQREIERILQRLSQLVAENETPLRANQEILAHFDLRCASARLSRRLGARSPELIDKVGFDLREARHPLLILLPDGSPREGTVVPIDLRLRAKQQALVISGPNTGGKSVALKTLGLLLLMVRAGLQIPCHPDSQVHLFGRIFADIGDEQSIEASLSTFSGHLQRIKQVLSEADRDSLVLLDEAGTGTDPAEGGALALAVLDSLRQRGSKVILTTHLNMIKGYAQLQDGVENAAVDFDPETLEPTYRLLYGVPGASNAFTIARQLGVPEEVLSTAESYMGQAERESGSLVEQLHQLKTGLQQQLEEASRAARQGQEEKRRLRRSRRAFDKERQEMRQQATSECEAMVQASRRQLDHLLQQARQQVEQAVPAPPEVARLKGELRQISEELQQQKPLQAPKVKAPQAVEPGEWVRIPLLDAEGQVRKADSAQLELEVGGKRMRLGLDSVEAFSPRRFSTEGEKRVRGTVDRSGFSGKLMLVGQRVDEATPLIERFLDDALLHHATRLEIVHGSGEGVLRKTVRDLLAKHPEVTAFYAADQKQGGDNVTLVEIKGE